MSASAAPKNSSGSSTCRRRQHDRDDDRRRAVEVARERLRGEDLRARRREPQRAERAGLELLGGLDRHDHHRDERDEQDDHQQHRQACARRRCPAASGRRARRPAPASERRRLAPRRARQRVGHERDDGLRGRRGVRRDEDVRPRGTARRSRPPARRRRRARRRRARRAAGRPPRRRPAGPSASTLLPAARRSCLAHGAGRCSTTATSTDGSVSLVVDRRVVEDGHRDRQREQHDDAPVAAGVAQVLEQDREDPPRASRLRLRVVAEAAPRRAR